VASYCLI